MHHVLFDAQDSDGAAQLVTARVHVQPSGSMSIVAHDSATASKPQTSVLVPALVGGFAFVALVVGAAIVHRRRTKLSQGKHTAGTQSASYSDEAGQDGFNPGAPTLVDDPVNAL